MYNGQGTLLSQLSGACFDGLWINGMPENMAVKLGITNIQNCVELAPGETFTICVECQTADDETMEGIYF